MNGPTLTRPVPPATAAGLRPAPPTAGRPVPARTGTGTAGRTDGLSRWRRLWPWFVLWPWSAAWAIWHLHGAGQSWHFMAAGGRLLLSGQPGGNLQLYAAHPQLQIGPLTLVVSGTLEVMGSWPSRVAAIAAMSVTGPPLLAAVWRLAPAAQRRRSRLFLTGLVFLPVWTEVTTHFAHLDDLLAMAFSVAAAHAVIRRRPVLAGLVLAAAADSKPWAAAFAPLLLALPRGQRWTALGAFTGGVAAAWLPFVLADPHTLVAAQFTIPNNRSSALRVLGVNAARTPWWDRPAQLTLGAAAGLVALRRGRWPAVILMAVCARILLDPGVYPYYTSGALLGTAIVDLVVTRWRLPWATAISAALLYAARFTGEVYPFTLHELGVLRAVFALGVPLLVLGVPGWLMARVPGRHARGGRLPGAGTQQPGAGARQHGAGTQQPGAGTQQPGAGVWHDAAGAWQDGTGDPWRPMAGPGQFAAGTAGQAGPRMPARPWSAATRPRAVQQGRPHTAPPPLPARRPGGQRPPQPHRGFPAAGLSGRPARGPH